MKSLNRILFNASLEKVIVPSEFPTENPVFAFSTAQNNIQVFAPYDISWTPFAIFQANNDDENISVPNERLLMIKDGTATILGDIYHVYSTDIPSSVLGNARATRVDFNVSFYARKDVEVFGETLRFIGVDYFDDEIFANVDTLLKNTFSLAEENDFVRVIDTNGDSEDWVYDGTNWSDTLFKTDPNDPTNVIILFDVQIQENVSEIQQYAIRKGKSTGFPTKKEDNTMKIIQAINLKPNFSDVYTQGQANNLFALNSVVTPHINDTDIHFSRASLNKSDVGLENVDNVQQIPLSEKGQPNGVATLDSGGIVPASQLPDIFGNITFVVTNLSDIAQITTQTTGDKVFVTSTQEAYIWDGSSWQLLSAGDISGKMDLDGLNSEIEKLKFVNQTNGATLNLGEIILEDNLPKWQISGNTKHLVGQQLLTRARNRTGATRAVGDPVFISGVFTPGGGPGTDVKEYELASRNTPIETFAVTSCPAQDNQDGCIITKGIVEGWNTSAFTAGDDLYLTDTPGQYTTTKPTSGKIVFIGKVIRASVNGIVFVNPTLEFDNVLGDIDTALDAILGV